MGYRGVPFIINCVAHGVFKLLIVNLKDTFDGKTT